MSARSPLGVPRGFLACTFSACIMAGLLGACTPEIPTNTNNSTSFSSTTQNTNSTSHSSNSSTTATSHAGLSPLGEASLEPRTHAPEAPGNIVITSVRAASHDGFDRIVFEATGSGTPGWIVDYSDKPTQHTTGDPIDVPGETALEVHITGTTYPFELGIPNPAIGRVELNTTMVTDIVDAGTFEGQSQFIVGIKGKRQPYAVQILENPTRVVVDILHNP